MSYYPPSIRPNGFIKENKMSYNIIKTMKNITTGEPVCVLLLNGLSEVLEIENLDEALATAKIFNCNSDSGWLYEVRSGGTIYKNEKK
jgi:hypothetical protein